MNTATLDKTYTWRDLVNMPDDGTERWIIKGQLREKKSEIEGATMTVRNRHHSDVMMGIGTALKIWTRTQPKPWGRVLGGEAGVILPDSPDDTIGVDVAYVSPELFLQQNAETSLFLGVPTLCVEILSPNDTINLIKEKTKTYLDAGVAIVWVVDPYDLTVTYYQANQRAVVYNMNQRIPEHPAMPGFSPTVAELFE